MKKITLSLCLFVATILTSTAQVKIGNNSTTIDPNSLLELESTNKGFLPPRVALSNETLVAPLTGTVPQGMMVYSKDGSLADGYYFWNGSKWASVATAGDERTNFVLVKSEADLPQASGGVITLTTNTFYEINGTITLSNKINLNGCSIQGEDALNDKLVYTGSGELFTGNNGGNIKFLTLTAASGKVFNVDASGAAKNFILQNCFIVGSNEVGMIKGFGGTVYMQTVAFQYNSNGISFQNNNNVINFNSLWDSNNSNTYEKYIGTFNIIQILGGDRVTSSSNSAKSIDVSGVTSLGAGTIKTVMFTGSGTPVVGNFSNSWEVESFGLNTEKDDVASANLYISSSANTVISTVDVPVKVAGTTTAASTFRVTMPTSNKLTYIGGKTRRFQVICSLTATAEYSSKNFSFHIYKNGTRLPESTQSMKLSSGTSAGSLTISCTVQLAPNDYIEVWVENNTDNTDVRVDNLNLSIK